MIEDTIKRMAAQKPMDKEFSKKNREKISKKRLLKIIEKKLTTSFIGAISEFEAKFGKLWGHGLHKNECSENQLKWRSLWDNTRNQILNKGNNQIRALENELELYSINWTGYQMNFTFNGGQNVNS